MSQPYVGQVVHYVMLQRLNGDKERCCAAIITRLDPSPEDVPEPGQVFAGLAILLSDAIRFRSIVLQDAEHYEGTWHPIDLEGNCV